MVDRQESSSLFACWVGRIGVMPLSGAALCLASAVAFGAMGIFGKLAYDEGVTVGTLLAVRFAIAAALFWVLLAATGGRRLLRGLPRRDVVLGVLLGAVGYSAQAGAYFAALRQLDASLLSLLLYTFPAMVAIAAVLLGRERLTRRTVGALLLAGVGGVLVLGGARAGALDPVGTALALTAAVVYSAYILTSAPVSGRMEPLVLATLVSTGAAVTLGLAGALDGDLHLAAVSSRGYGWLAAIAVVSTVGAITLFFAGLRRVGPTAASIISTAEPVTAVALAGAVFGETLGPAQLAGGALVVGAVVVLAAPRRSRPVAVPVLAAEATR
jgi:drug/metabolite transporter (DMT)-like permease